MRDMSLIAYAFIRLDEGWRSQVFIGPTISIFISGKPYLQRPLRPHKKKLVYHPSHPKKVRREGGFYFYFFYFFNLLYTRFCCTMWVYKLHYYADIVAVVVCDKTCDTGREGVLRTTTKHMHTIYEEAWHVRGCVG
jgi:hypothetical protein